MHLRHVVPFSLQDFLLICDNHLSRPRDKGQIWQRWLLGGQILKEGGTFRNLLLLGTLIFFILVKGNFHGGQR